MTIKQLSVFLENKTGRINDVARILGEHGINMYAFSMAETADFGILRMIVSDVEAAKRVLREAKFAVTGSPTWWESTAPTRRARSLRCWIFWPASRSSSNICTPFPKGNWPA